MKVLAAVLLLSVCAWAQDSGRAPEKRESTTAPQKKEERAEGEGVFARKPWVFTVWSAGGVSVPGGTKNVWAANAGFRAGKVMTREIGGGPLRGNLEAAIEVIPVYVVSQRETAMPGVPGAASERRIAWGGGVTPLASRWNFTAARRATPYLELTTSVLFSSRDVPQFTSRVNFVSAASLGMHVFRGENRALTVATRYAHISNAGLAIPNPGINTVQVVVGWTWFR